MSDQVNAAVLLDELNRAGATLEMAEGVPRIRGAAVPDELKQRLRLNRAAVLAEWERRNAEGKDRFGRVPEATAPMVALNMTIPTETAQAVMAYVMRQARPVHAFVMTRAAGYFDRGGVKANDTEWRACLDVVAWQRLCTGAEAARFVMGLPTDAEMAEVKGEKV